jgi:hypothetical protein
MPQSLPLLPPIQPPPDLPIQQIPLLPSLLEFNTTPPSPGVGYVTFPGINFPIKCIAPRSNGVTPDSAVLYSLVQQEAPQQYGDLVLNFTQNTVTWKNCLVDSGTTMYSTKGHFQTWRIKDRRWAWAKSWVTGEYNPLLYDVDGEVGARRGNVRYLMEVLLTLMGETRYDVSAVDNEQKPHKGWDWANCADELQKLLDEYGYVISLQLDDSVKVSRSKVGTDLPDNDDIISPSMVFDPAELPERLIAIAGLTLVETRLKMEPVGEDTDGKIKPVDDLSYKPVDGWVNNMSTDMLGVGASETDPVKAKDMKALAKKTVFKWYRVVHQSHEKNDIKDPFGQIIEKYAPEELNITDYQQYLPLSLDLNRQINGAYVSVRWDGATVLESARSKKNIQVVKFDTIKWKLDEKLGIIKFEDPITKNKVRDTGGMQASVGIDPDTETAMQDFADVFFTCSYTVTDDETGIKDRYTRELTLGGRGVDIVEMAPPNNQRMLTAEYDDPGGKISIEEKKITDSAKTVVNNEQTLNSRLDELLQKTARTYQTRRGYVVKYRGVQLINTDGMTKQVVWRIGDQRDVDAPFNTQAVQNMEITPGMLNSRRKKERATIRRLEVAQKKVNQYLRKHGEI